MSSIRAASGTRGPRRALAAVETATAVGALAGAVGLATGSMQLGAAVDARLPRSSPVLAACALLVVVALPMALAATAGWSRSTRAD